MFHAETTVSHPEPMMSLVDQRAYPTPAMAARMIPMMVPHFSNLIDIEMDFFIVHFMMFVMVSASRLCVGSRVLCCSDRERACRVTAGLRIRGSRTGYLQ